MKKAAAAAAGLLAAILLMGGLREIIWHLFEPREVVGSTAETDTENLEEVSSKWFEMYFEQFKGWTVPYDYRILDAKIVDTTILTELGEPYVQIDYKVEVASDNLDIVQNLNLIGTDVPKVYNGQMVLGWERTDGGFRIQEKLTPVQYQLKTPQMQQEIAEEKDNQIKQYLMKKNEPMTYDIQEGVLYVTYDGGESFAEVPGAYEKVCREANGTMNELLTDGSYLITPEFTAFTGYTSTGTTLLYSLDAGKTWEESQIYGSEYGGYKAKSFISRTENGCYVTIATDRAMGSDYYATFWSGDLQNWNRMDLPETLWSNLTYVFWASDTTGYYAGGEMLSMTEDGGTSWQEISWPEAVQVTKELGFNPFDSVERIYESEGRIYMIIGQGDDGDYAKGGKLMKALYQSSDGKTFSFVKEIRDDTPEEEG